MSASDLAITDLNDDLRPLVEGVLDGEQLSLSRLISRIENGAPGYQDAVKTLHDHTTGTRTIGITGQPGSGKSTLVDKLVDRLREQDLTVGVIAVDPSSPYSGGSVLGDRVRQTSRNEDPNVFFRSMSARGHVGGLAAATFDVVHAMDAFGKDVILIETVGAGQNEVEIVRAADTVCVVAIPGAGDDVQANKAGILEIADVFAVNKADLDGATATAQELQQMIRIGQDLERSDTDDPVDDPDTWVPRVELTAAIKDEGVENLVDAFDAHYAFIKESGELAETRARRFEQEVRTHMGNELDQLADAVAEARRDLLAADADVDPYTASEELVVPFRRAVEEYIDDG
ncbi:methylmalonyl Co-A mutase-associated GTPase MeaB (plasmid) [Natrinema zhouii]|uniref:methylmalonyl Co-A mutase-associated GTPase MeaB n=1 Tax=Natrinema zhouii TaxID=1710539 RepID=UPI001CFFD1CB|nr:methylmalonyl Co-A mutase-associated GTPase MeaB [Natrinema zhouii]UHQ98748.1 methylmalonyl Co-A mutase-associated GTPase MeaB [Natrinema zhouii]